jgi:uncharacterized membrane protein
MSITFNHEAESFHESLGINSNEFAERLAEVIKKFFNTAEEQPISKLSELLYNRMTDAEILLLASSEVLNKFDEMENDMETMEKMFKNLFNEN